jgi:ATP-dependent exoDNAse (exonuclease V) beta subunit
VGDVKQAIFAWREGDPRLMGEIRELYNRGQERPIITQPLDRSWRSGPAIIGMVNAVFGSAAIGELFPGRASAEWKRQWRDHTTAFPGRSGQAALLHAADAAERKKLTLDLLSELSPLDKGLTCAVLVQRNTEATELADYLRREGGIPAVAESDLRVCADNPAGAAMLALFQTAAHPGDRLAWEHVGMTPLGAALAAEGVSTPGELSMRLLAQVNAEGFERTAEYWLSRLERALAPGNRFARERARQFAAAAALFDATGRRSVDEFSAFMESHAVREPESAAVVRVMTIHKSKGLGFDVVIVPELEGTRIDEPRAGLIVQTDAAHEVQWLLDRPTALFVRNDPVLSRHLAEAEQDACYESLSLLYVALTRAKRALFVITEPTEGSSSRNFPRLLGAALGESGRAVRVGNIELTGAWSAGEPDWHHNLSPTARMKDAEDSPPVSLPPAPRRVARRPSGEEQGRPVCGAIFDLHGHDAREFGTAVHRLLAEVEWCEPSAVAALGEGWLKSGAPREAVEHATRVLLDSSLADLWHPPAKGQFGAIWRERAFEVVMEDAWISGVIDRVRVQLDGTGRPARAWVWDFKTDAVPSGTMSGEVARRHASQLLVYRRVVARLTGLPVESVQAELVYTATAQRVSMVTEG